MKVTPKHTDGVGRRDPQRLNPDPVSPPTSSSPLEATVAFAELRRQVTEELRAAGCDLPASQESVHEGSDKELLRWRHRHQREAALRKSLSFISRREDDLIGWFADGRDVDPGRIFPELVPVSSPIHADLFRFAALHWSVPVSRGFGRRTRFLVMDRSNDKLIGLIALGDPVFNLAARDAVIGWDQADRRERLYNVLDAFVLGAVEPYRQLIAGKLIAMCAISRETIDFVEGKYRGSTTVLYRRQRESRPTLITTTSALGRSAIYNRLSFYGRPLFIPVGYTAGFGHFQFSDNLFAQLVDVAARSSRYRDNTYGSGPNWKIRTIRIALKELGLSGDLLRHGIKRQVFLAPVAKNWKEYLKDGQEPIEPMVEGLEDIAEYYRMRWAIPRSERRPEFRAWSRDGMRLANLARGLDSEARLF